MHPGVIAGGVAAGLLGLAGLGAAAVVATGAMGNSNNAKGTCPLTNSAVSILPPTGGGGNSGGQGVNNAPLFKTIISMSQGSNRAIAAGLLGSDLESGWRDDAIGAGSAGPWQVQLTVHHDITLAEAEDPVISTHYWFPNYLAALPSSSDQDWQSNPEYAAENTAYNAEHPSVNYYEGQGAAIVHAKWAQTLQVMAKYGISTNFSSDSSGGMPNTNNDPTSLATAVFASDVSTTGTCTDGVYNDKGGSTDGGNNPNPPGNILTGAPIADKTRRAIVQLAAYWIGEPYSYAGGDASGPTYGVCTNDAGWNDCNIKGFDCSGLTMYVAAQVLGLQLPHNAAEQWNILRSGYAVVVRGGSLANALPGDFIYFTGSDGSYDAPGHVGIYIGNGKMIDAPQSGEKVSIADVTTPYWLSSFVGVGDPVAYAKAAGRSIA